MSDVVLEVAEPATRPALGPAVPDVACLRMQPLKAPALPDPFQLLHLPTSFSELLYFAAIAGTGIVGLAACWHASAKSEVPMVHLRPSAPALRIINRVTALDRPYQPRPFCSHGHVETVAAAVLRPRPRIALHRTCHPLADGGCIALDWLLDPPSPDPPAKSHLPPDTPVALLLPGRLAGSQDAGLQHAALLFQTHAFRVVTFNPRGAGGSPLTSAALPSLAPTADLAAAIHHVAAAYPAAPLVAVGWSLGANLLVRYLGSVGPASPIQAAVAVSTPFDLPTCLRSLHTGLNHLVYGRHAVEGLKAVLRASSLLWTAAPADAAAALRSNTLASFDAALASPPPTHPPPPCPPTSPPASSFPTPAADLEAASPGTSSPSSSAAAASPADEYSAMYSHLSCKEALRTVAVPLLLMAALDDPIVPPATLPLDAVAANPACVLVTTTGGGHMGWLGGAPALLRYTWSDEVAVEFLQSALVEAANAKLHRLLGVCAAPPSLHDTRWMAAIPCAAAAAPAPSPTVQGVPAHTLVDGSAVGSSVWLAGGGFVSSMEGPVSAVRVNSGGASGAAPSPTYQPATSPHPPASPNPPASAPWSAAPSATPASIYYGPLPLVPAPPAPWLSPPTLLLNPNVCPPMAPYPMMTPYPMSPPRNLSLPQPLLNPLFWGDARTTRPHPPTLPTPPSQHQPQPQPGPSQPPHPETPSSVALVFDSPSTLPALGLPPLHSRPAAAAAADLEAEAGTEAQPRGPTPPQLGSSPTRLVDDALLQWDLMYTTTRMQYAVLPPLPLLPAAPPAASCLPAAGAPSQQAADGAASSSAAGAAAAPRGTR